MVFEQKLLARQAEVHGWIDGLAREAAAHGVAGARGAPADPEGWARLADREQHAFAELRAVDRALDRLKWGSFGLCQECGEPISFARLEAQPWVETCDDCDAMSSRR